MTIEASIPTGAAAAASTPLVERFRALFDELGAEAPRRERERRLPHAEVARLRDAGFTRVTLPIEHGGEGVSHAEFFDLLAELARRDPNLAQLYRSHFSFVDRTALAPPSAERDARLRLVADGLVIGNASHERTAAKVGSLSTKLARGADGRLRLDGTKHYSTGALFADIVSVAAEDEDGQHVGVLVRGDAPGVDRIDDWNGFGQRLTGSGTTVFDAVEVDERAVVRFGERRPSHGSAYVQLVLLAVVAGIGRTVLDDAVRFVRARTRVYSHGSGPSAAGDPIVQEVVGELDAASFAADAAVARVAAGLDASTAAQLGGAADEELRTIVERLDAETARAQLVVLPNVLDASTKLFEVGGASATDADLALDRHWRNARTVASHNPARYKARALGELRLAGTPVAGWWSTGEG
ncbi:acyl-CoA dehydrogenase family protein [Agromyces seonyuensis]|uniref:Dibenzothiophene monooxygenase n=1 Tax=Agromyces seonyuensis TaxID=2662446 RepID=A0A6I4NZ20_9MICO|nr:acyl-CoA dehydrogenase family protein [Agromyces seonyuensis]MWB99528.1 hypothetical protein [Agromyces seonyuensis]